MKPEAEAILRFTVDLAQVSRVPELHALAVLAVRVLRAEGLDVDELRAPLPSTVRVGKTSTERVREWRKVKRGETRNETHETVSSVASQPVSLALSSPLSGENSNKNAEEREGEESSRGEGRNGETQHETQRNSVSSVSSAGGGRRKHKYPETVPPDPHGDASTWAAWCGQWGFSTGDKQVQAMARWHYGKGSAWRDWKAALRTWQDKEKARAPEQANTGIDYSAEATARLRESAKREREAHEARIQKEAEEGARLFSLRRGQ